MSYEINSQYYNSDEYTFPEHFAPRRTKMNRRNMSDDDNINCIETQENSGKTLDGILSEDEYINKLNGKSYSQFYFEKQEKTQLLPIRKHIQDLLMHVIKNPICLITGTTGSGKSTQLPQILLTKSILHQISQFSTIPIPLSNERFPNIVITQPRKLAAIELASRVASELDVDIGSYVGYSVRFEEKRTNKSLITYMTEGMLLKELMHDRKLNRYDIIIIDEAHERTLECDLLLSFLKKLSSENLALRIIIMSATLDSNELQRFFNNAPLYSVEGKTYPVSIHFSETPINDIIDTTVYQALHIFFSIPKNQMGDILVFLSGESEIEKAVSWCHSCYEQDERCNNPAYPECVIMKLYGQMSPDQQHLVFTALPRSKRKIIFATNIAETSITIEGVTVIIDSGVHKQNIFYQENGVQCLVETHISQASAKQRAGRAGRVCPGTCYRLYTQSLFNSFPKQDFPEMQRVSLTNIILFLIQMGEENLIGFDYISPPSADSLINALNELILLEAVSNNGKPTKFGQIACNFPLPVSYTKTIIYNRNNPILVIAIISMLSCGGRVILENFQNLTSNEIRNQLISSFGDLITLWNIWCEFHRQTNQLYWCKQVGINYRDMEQSIKIFYQLSDFNYKYNSFQTINKTIDCSYSIFREIQAQQLNNKYLETRKSFVQGLFLHSALHNGNGKYINFQHNEITSACDSISYLKANNFKIKDYPRWIIYHELVLTRNSGSIHMRRITPVELSWLYNACPSLFLPDESKKSIINEELKSIINEELKSIINEELKSIINEELNIHYKKLT